MPLAQRAQERIIEFVTDSNDHVAENHPRCGYCGLPAVCFGAGFVNPKHRCPRCCRERRQFGGRHGPDNYLVSHLTSEGVSFGGMA